MTNQTSREEQDIQQVIERFTEAWNVHDANAFSSVFAKDADFTNVFGKKLHGAAAIGAFHATIFSTMFKASSFNATETSVRFLTSDLAAVDVMWQMSGATDFQGNPWPDRKGLMSLVMKNEAGSWSILIMHNMDLPPVPNP